MRRAFPLLLAAAVLAAVTACSPRPTLHVGRLADQPHSTLMAELVVEMLRIAGARNRTGSSYFPRWNLCTAH